MRIRAQSLVYSFCLIVFTFSPALVRAEGNVEAVIAPHYALQYKSEPWKSGIRNSFRLDFARISSGVSLNMIIGSGLGYTDYGGLLRFFGTHGFMGDQLRLWYGVGIGATYTSGAATSVSGLSSKFSYTDVIVNPFVRLTYDLNGWVAPFVEVSWEPGVVYVGKENIHYGGKDRPLLRQAISFSMGVAFEVER